MTEEIIRKEAETSDKFGQWERPLSEMLSYGMMNIDKPKGPTSHQVSSYVQDILGINKSGHSGTLDPKVTGVLPVATGRATRIVNYLLPAGKEYVCLMHLHDEHQEYEIRKAISSFVGVIEQLPPLKSAIKRRVRKRKIYYIKINDIKGQDVLFTISCQAGTYIRKLCHDIGNKLGSGAHMAQLLRTRAGLFSLENSWTLQDLADAKYYYDNGNEKFLRDIIMPVEKAVDHLPKVWVMDTTVENLCHGADLAVPGISRFTDDIRPEMKVAVLTLKNELIGIGTSRMEPEQIMSGKGIAVKTEKIFMEPGLYPRISR
ncbi:MAG: RNA-guided pseudouridylation complex pseudouridine synthase subunit Cbf5 [Nanobdellota archaeon]